jgi:hypothetical protein
MDQDVQAARDKLAARFANQTQIGGKGKIVPTRDDHCWRPRQATPPRPARAIR